MAAVPVPVPHTSSGYLQLYGPAAVNFAATIGVFVYLKSQISSIKASECKHDPEAQDAIMARLDKIEETMKKLIGGLNNLHQGVVGHEQALRDAGLISVPPAGPVGDEGDRPKPAKAAKSVPKTAGKKAVPKSAAPKASPKTPPKPVHKVLATETEVEDELDGILDAEAEAEPDFDLATEAVEDPEPPEPPKPKAKAAVPKKNFKKD